MIFPSPPTSPIKKKLKYLGNSHGYDNLSITLNIMVSNTIFYCSSKGSSTGSNQPENSTLMLPDEVIQTPTKRAVGKKCKNKKQAQKKEAVAPNSPAMGTRSKVKL
jgi:hypothetical protein